MPAKKRSRPAASKRAPARKPARKIARRPVRAPKAARKAAAKPRRKAAAKPARKVTTRSPRKATAKPARKPTRAAKPKRVTGAAKTRRRGRGVATLPIPPARARGPKRRRRTPKAPEIIPQIVIEDEPQPTEALAPETPAEMSDGERQDTRRYMAVVSEIEGTEPFPAQESAPLFPHRVPSAEVETYATDIPIALGAALLAASVFFPWYKGPSGFPVSVTGWASGSLGPLLVFLGAGSIILVALRRVGVTVSLPVEESLVHEAAGWLALVAAVVKSRWRPNVLGIQIATSYGVWIAIGAAALLVVLAGRMSPRAPLVLRPGWHRARGGTLGAALLVVMVAGAAAFGVVNSPSTSGARSGPREFPGTVRNKLPDCAKDFPLPAGLKPQLGFDAGTVCQAQLSSTRDSVSLLNAARAALKKARWTFTETKLVPGTSTFSITKPRCASLTVVGAQRGSILVIQYTSCSSPSPTPSPTRR